MLYVCATPIGNLQDISLRALAVLNSSDIILCEDTRVSYRLLNYHNVCGKKLVAFHAYNEAQVSPQVIEWLKSGLIVTQLTDAGTPSISDPGARLCELVLQQGLKCSPIPGACAYVSILSVSGVCAPSLFYGFLPNQSIKRRKILTSFEKVNYSVCIYESPHRVVECLSDIVAVLGYERILVMGRELTKQFETIIKTTAGKVLEFVQADSYQQLGEFVFLIAPAIVQKSLDSSLTIEQMKALELLLLDLPPKRAAIAVHKLFGGDKDLLYKYAIAIRHNDQVIAKN